MKIRNFIILSLLFMALYDLVAQSISTPVVNREKTSFQTSNPWRPEIDVRSDVAIIYGTSRRRGMSFEERVQTWKDHGYNVHFMTGIAWGDYNDYFSGNWDGINHMDEGQVNMEGDTLWHDKRVIPYLVPSGSFIKYMNEVHIKRVIDAGIDAIYLEEPEFWARAGYSEAFKREWENFYGFPWQPQHISPENTYLSNKLKYQLYYNALEKVFSFAKQYGKSKGLDVRCYVPTHSLINYSAWEIVSPMASLASLPSVDGYIAQVWTGTAREETYYNGIEKERVFENALLEYECMESMTKPTGRKIIFLSDPIEDTPRDWEDFKKNYEATFAAQLMFPNVDHYEVMPWPERIYGGHYQKPGSDQKELIPRVYSTQMQIMINALNDIPVSENPLNGSPGIGVLMANSLMFQRFPTHQGYEDPQLSNFYGQALPMIKRGIPLNIVHIENLSFPETLRNIRILIMSYSNMKPVEPDSHEYIANWIRDGGMLIYCGRDEDPFQKVTEWWNNGEKKYACPSDHLFEKLGICPAAKPGKYHYGKGTLTIIRQNPKEFVMYPGGDKEYVEAIEKLYNQEVKEDSLIFKNFFIVERGPYIIAAVMDESNNTRTYKLNGSFIDLFDPELPVIEEKVIEPGEQAFLYNLNYSFDHGRPKVLASAARITEKTEGINLYSFIAKSPENTTNSMRIFLPEKPHSIISAIRTNDEIIKNTWDWDDESKTLQLNFENSPEGIKVILYW